jgi:hypothetical protein
MHICCECSLTVHADYLIILFLSEIQRVFCQFKDVAKNDDHAEKDLSKFCYTSKRKAY